MAMNSLNALEGVCQCWKTWQITLISIIRLRESRHYYEEKKNLSWTTNRFWETKWHRVNGSNKVERLDKNIRIRKFILGQHVSSLRRRRWWLSSPTAQIECECLVLVIFHVEVCEFSTHLPLPFISAWNSQRCESRRKLWRTPLPRIVTGSAASARKNGARLMMIVSDCKPVFDCNLKQARKNEFDCLTNQLDLEKASKLKLGMICVPSSLLINILQVCLQYSFRSWMEFCRPRMAT